MDAALLSNERIILSQPARLLLGMEQAAQAPAPAIQPFGAMRGTAAALVSFIQGQPIDGQLYLTNYRFYFEAHGENWARGTYSIFLPTVESELERDGILSDELRINSKTGQHRFVVRNASEFLDALNDPQRAAPDVEVLKIYVTAELDRVGAGMSSLWKGTHPSDEVLRHLEDAVEGKQQNALRSLAVLTALELFV